MASGLHGHHHLSPGGLPAKEKTVHGKDKAFKVPPPESSSSLLYLDNKKKQTFFTDSGFFVQTSLMSSISPLSPPARFHCNAK